MHFTLAQPLWLLGLLFVPCFFLCKGAEDIFYLPRLDWAKPRRVAFDIDTWLKVAIFSLMVIALADPYLFSGASHAGKKGRDLVLTLDASGSMAQSGFDGEAPEKSKFELLTQIVSRFLHHRFDDNVGIVAFGSFAYPASPLSYDTDALGFVMRTLTPGIAGESTAIGDAIITALRVLRRGKAKSKVIVLVTDGFHNAGSVSPKRAVAMAKKSGVRIYTIGLGGVNTHDAALLERIAKESGGAYFAAADAAALEAVFRKLDDLEPSPVRSEAFIKKRLLYGYLLIAALLLYPLLLYRTRGRDAVA